MPALTTPDGTPLSPFCLGTAVWGTRLTGSALDRLYAAFRDAGGNCFDTAHNYAAWLPDGFGVSERTLADLVRRHGDAGRVLIATKGGHSPFAGYPRPDAYQSPERIAQDVAESLDRLGADHIDLYYLHRDDPRVPVGEVVDVLAGHVAAGRLRHLGVSNWTTPRVTAAQQYATANGRPAFVATQPKYGLAVANKSEDPTVPDFTDADADRQAAAGLTVFAYTPTASGYFATRGQAGRPGFDNPASARRLAAATWLAAELGTSPNAVALAWLLHRTPPAVPILGTTDVGHLVDALAAAELRPTLGQLAGLTA